MILPILLAAVIAFPKEGQMLPFLTRCYLSGAVAPGTSNVVVQGRAVPVHPMGGWVTMMTVVEGTNTVEVAGVTRTFRVARRPKADATPAVASASSAVPKKAYAKLPYAGDEPKPRPRGRAPSAVTVVLDPGHGGAETGAMSPHGLRESDLNLALARNVRDALSRRGYRVVMTRDADVTVPLYDRPKVAHAQGADAFVSIHHNAPAPDQDPRGVRYHAVYAWNAIGGELAQAINARLTATFGETLADGGVRRANFAVTRNPEIPSCLVETDFLTTPEGELDCWNRDRRRRVAEALADALDDWCGRPDESAADDTEGRHGDGTR